MRRPWTKLQFPKEHGAWAMWIVPYVMGVLTAKETRWSHLALGVGFFLAFLGQPAVRSSLRAGRAPRSPVFWGQMLAAVPLIAIPIIQGKGMLGLFCFSAFEVGLIAGLLPWLELGQQKSVPARLLSVALLTSTALAAHIASGTVGPASATLYLLNFLFFARSLFYVKAIRLPRLRTQARVEALLWSRVCLAYLAFLAGTLAMLIGLGMLAPLTSLSFLPTVVYTVVSLRRQPEHVDIRRIGVLEAIQSVLFLVIMTFLWKGPYQ
jgi:4-hydroxybenzoate polyprenyltransferase